MEELDIFLSHPLAAIGGIALLRHSEIPFTSGVTDAIATSMLSPFWSNNYRLFATLTTNL